MKKIISLLLVVLAVSSLNGCTSINEVDEDKVKDVTDKLTEVLVNTVGNEKAERMESHSINAAGLSMLKVTNSVGNIDITTSDSDEATIDLNIAAKTGSTEKSEQLVSDFIYSIETTSDSIDINTSFKEIKIDDTNISTDLKIAVPNNINNIIISSNIGDIFVEKINGEFDISNNVGNITIKNSKSSYNIITNVGEIVVSEASADKSSEFTTNTGDIDVVFNDITGAESIKAVTDVGDISLKVPKDSSYEAEISEFMGNERTEKNKDGLTKIKLKTGVGDIDFN